MGLCTAIPFYALVRSSTATRRRVAVALFVTSTTF
jgi:hypothetical protein